MATPGKAAVGSLGFWGSVTSIGSLLGLIVKFQDVIQSIPPELISDTQAWFLAVGALVGPFLALVGRWKAVVPITGLFKAKR